MLTGDNLIKPFFSVFRQIILPQQHLEFGVENGALKPPMFLKILPSKEHVYSIRF
jgi:hypothetical protein